MQQADDVLLHPYCSHPSNPGALLKGTAGHRTGTDGRMPSTANPIALGQPRITGLGFQGGGAASARSKYLAKCTLR